MNYGLNRECVRVCVIDNITICNNRSSNLDVLIKIQILPLIVDITIITSKHE